MIPCARTVHPKENGKYIDLIRNSYNVRTCPNEYTLSSCSEKRFAHFESKGLRKGEEMEREMMEWTKGDSSKIADTVP